MNFRNILKIIKEYNLTPEEMFYIELLLYHINGSSEELKEYISQQNGLLLLMIFESLMEKGVLSKLDGLEGNKGKPSININNVSFTDNFLSNHFIFAKIAGQELMDNYPPYLDIDGKQCSAHTISKFFKSKEDMFITYGRKINFDKSLHQEIIKSLKYAVQAHIISFGIAEYVIGEHWTHHINAMSKKGTRKTRYIE